MKKRYNIYTDMEFEYDPAKSQSNREKHGLDFEEAQGLWDDGNRLIFPARSETESRWALLAVFRERVWIAFYTFRGDVVRIVSVRRARKGEKDQYYDR